MDNNFNNNDNEYNNNENKNSGYDYNPYTNPETGFHEVNEPEDEPIDVDYTYVREPRQEQPQQPVKKKPFEGFGVTLIKTVAIALVFGLVAGIVGCAVINISGVASDIVSDADSDSDDNHTGNGSNKVQDLRDTDTADDVITVVTDVSDIAASVMPSVVAISNTTQVTYQSMWGQRYTQESESAGTGFIVEQDDEYIYIATNNHVVAESTSLSVQFSDGTEAKAEIKGTVATKDLAVIKVALADISADTLNEIRVATLGDSTELEVGEAAIAIGNALGYGQSVTTGVISALGRSVTVTDSSTGTTVVNNNLIQTDAAINPGNSGGALVNAKGEVIGINSVKYSDTDVEGMGYAIPISDAMLIIDKLLDGEKIDETQSGYLGIQGQDSSLGVYIYYVFEGSAAEDAGLQAGDIITEFEGTEISTMSQLKELLSYYPAGEEVEFVILRPNGREYKEMGITVVLGDASTIENQ